MNTLPFPNGRQNTPAPQPQVVPTVNWEIYLRGPGNDGLKPVMVIGHVSALRALLVFASQCSPDVDLSLQSVRVERVTPSLIVTV